MGLVKSLEICTIWFYDFHNLEMVHISEKYIFPEEILLI